GRRASKKHERLPSFANGNALFENVFFLPKSMYFFRQFWEVQPFVFFEIFAHNLRDAIKVAKVRFFEQKGYCVYELKFIRKTENFSVLLYKKSYPGFWVAFKNI